MPDAPEKHWLVKDAEEMPLYAGGMTLEYRITLMFLGAMKGVLSPLLGRAKISAVREIFEAHEQAQEVISLRFAEYHRANPAQPKASA